MFALTAIRGMGRRISNIVCLSEHKTGTFVWGDWGTGDLNMDNLHIYIMIIYDYIIYILIYMFFPSSIVIVYNASNY